MTITMAAGDQGIRYHDIQQWQTLND